ncbi:hypothetical protein BKA62DRAFT_700172 [Auriculariales sp. MPI-PUGE-AT-0066]|nr:hypothetical protein BKA62DRAFT_700172 [Auriculariales sp. MPI-PUGE-AT-0066]
MSSGDSQPLLKFADAAWLEDAAVNPKTGQPWAYNDKLVCSCGAEIHVHSHGFRALAKHRETKTHQSNMQKKIKRLIRDQRSSQISSVLDEAKVAIAISALDAPLKVKQHHANLSSVKRDAHGELKSIVAAKSSHHSSVISAKSKENTEPSAQTASGYAMKLTILRSERANIKADLEHETDAVTRASLNGHLSRLRKQISDLKVKEAEENIKKPRPVTMSATIQGSSDDHSSQDSKSFELSSSKSSSSKAISASSTYDHNSHKSERRSLQASRRAEQKVARDRGMRKSSHSGQRVPEGLAATMAQFWED